MYIHIREKKNGGTKMAERAKQQQTSQVVLFKIKKKMTFFI